MYDDPETVQSIIGHNALDGRLAYPPCNKVRLGISYQVLSSRFNGTVIISPAGFKLVMGVLQSIKHPESVGSVQIKAPF